MLFTMKRFIAAYRNATACWTHELEPGKRGRCLQGSAAIIIPDLAVCMQACRSKANGTVRAAHGNAQQA